MIGLPVFWAVSATTTLVFGGDIMLNGIAPSAKTFKNLGLIVGKSDCLFGNLEIPLTNSRDRTRRKSEADLKKKNQWILKADPRHSPFLKAAGFGAVSLANNHAMDYGARGMHEMIGLLDRQRIEHAGAGALAKFAMKPAVIELTNRSKVALLSALGFQSTGALRKTTPATTSTPGIAVLNMGGTLTAPGRAKLGRWIGRARKLASIVVVAMHWGVERKPVPTPYQVAMGRALVDAGADVVWGNHPHVLQGAEFYKGKLIMYSMGNLISSLPAKSGFLKLTIGDDGGQTVEFEPSDVRGGAVLALKPKAVDAARKSMAGLCRLLLKHYPSKDSMPAFEE